VNRAPADALEIFLQPGEFYFGEEKTRIRTLLGSCVAITLWHPRLRIGGMAHYMLPQRPNRSKDQPLDGRYAEEVMLMFQRELQDTRTRPGEYQVKLFGGGHMFAYAPKSKCHVDVSERNIDIGRRLMVQHGFKILAEDLGGDGHRTVAFDLWSGDAWLKKAARTPSGGG
jgi:chemotaxis protein CheD